MALPIRFNYHINGDEIELCQWEKRGFPFELKRGYSIRGNSESLIRTDHDCGDYLVVDVKDVSRDSSIKAREELERMLSPLKILDEDIFEWGKKVESLYLKTRPILPCPREGYEATLNDYNNVVFRFDFRNVRRNLTNYLGKEKFEELFRCLNNDDNAYSILSTDALDRKIDSKNPVNPKVDVVLGNGLRLISMRQYTIGP